MGIFHLAFKCRTVPRSYLDIHGSDSVRVLVMPEQNILKKSQSSLRGIAAADRLHRGSERCHRPRNGDPVRKGFEKQVKRRKGRLRNVCVRRNGIEISSRF